jgi:hypothetical protein
MIDGKPLHIRVAEALGRKPCPKWKVWGVGLAGTEWTHDAQGCNHLVPCYPPSDPPRYDTNWSVTGPLIEKYGISVWVTFPGDFGQDGFRWAAQMEADARSPMPNTVPHVGRTPLEAVCYLIIELARIGKLK